jgi:predicted Zn-dependent peptidase
VYKKSKLANGVKVVSHRMPGMQSVTVGVWINVGSRYESVKEQGISHFLEHMLFKGSKKYSCRKIKEAIEGIGGSLNGFTAEENTCYLAKVPSQYGDLAFEILSDMSLHPLLNPEDIVKEKTVVIEEIKMYRDLPQSYVYELLDALLWPDQPLGTPIIGNEGCVNSFTRDDLLRFMERFYSPSNIVVSAAGALSHEKLLTLASRAFSSLKKSAPSTFSTAQEAQDKPQLTIFTKDTAQTHMALGFHGFKRDHPLRHVAALLHIILGANMSSRLFEEVREKRGLAYEIGSQIKRFADTGAFLVHAGIDNSKVFDATRVILGELALIKEKMVGKDELKRAKEFYVGQLRLALEDTMDQMIWIGESTATLDKTFTLESIVKEIKKVNADDIRGAARQLFRQERLNMSMIGPLAEAERLKLEGELRV